MDVNKKIHNATLKLLDYIEKEEYKGYDSYDALKSPLFNLPLLRTNKLIRFCAQQFVKRFPLNLRLLLLIPKGLNPVTLGLCVQAYAYLSEIFPDMRQDSIEKIQALTGMLQSLAPEGYSGACWGYDFDWEAKHARIPAFQPTAVGTGIITNGLFTAWKMAGVKQCRDLCLSTANFVMKDLQRTYDGENFCFSYSPFDRQQVFNASMKGARLLAQVYSETKDPVLQETARHAVDFVVSNQRDDGSWGYSRASKGGWTDNYHTGYVFDCLDEYMNLTGDDRYKNSLARGYAFYRDHFVTTEGIPKFYHDKIYPVDCTAAAQTILTLCRFGDIDLAKKVAVWMIGNMQAKTGYFYFRKFRHYTIKTSFMRWSNSWMLLGLSELLSVLSKNNFRNQI